MQRPRITKKLAASLGYAASHLSTIYEDMWGDDYSREMREDMKRSIDYLEATIRWAKAQEKRRKK